MEYALEIQRSHKSQELAKSASEGPDGVGVTVEERGSFGLDLAGVFFDKDGFCFG